LLVLALGIAYVRQTRVPAPPPGITPTRLFEQVFAKVRSSAVDPVEDEELYRRAAAGIIEELDDPYAVLLLPGEKPPPSEDAPVGPGLFIDRRDGLPVVVALVPGSPAEAAGVLPGDRLLAVDSTTIDPDRLDLLVKALDGAPGSSLTLRVRRAGVRGPVALAVTRGALPVDPALEAVLLSGGVARIRITRFMPGLVDSVRLRLEQLRAEGARSLVLDLRSTVQGGNELAQGVALADLFLDDGKLILTSKARPATESSTYVDHSSSPYASMPLAVLIDAGTAGAAEIVAGALQDHDRAVVLGRSSFGRGVTQSRFRLGDGATLSLTTSLWITPSGRQIQRPPRPQGGDTLARPRVKSDGGRTLLGGGGIVPDREFSGTDHQDRVLAEAHRVLMRAASPAEVLVMLGNLNEP
jgi:carboxyl-terminal processing protease